MRCNSSAFTESGTEAATKLNQSVKIGKACRKCDRAKFYKILAGLLKFVYNDY